MLREGVMNIFPRSPLWDEIREPEKSLTSTDHISENIANQALKFCDNVPQDFGFAPSNFQLLKLRKQKVIMKIPWWLVWSNETLESKALIPNVVKPTPKIEERRYQRLRNKPLQRGNLQYITWMNNLGWYKWQNILSIYRSPWGHNVILAYLTIII